MKPAEVVMKCERFFKAKTGGVPEVENFIKAIYPQFVLDFFMLHSESDADYRDEVDMIMENKDFDALREFIMIDEENQETREFDGFQYEFGFEPGEDGMDKYSFKAVSHKTIDEVLNNLAFLNINMVDLAFKYDVSITLNDTPPDELIRSFPGIPAELFVEVSPGEVVLGGIPVETEEVTESIGTVDTCDSETLKYVRLNKDWMPDYMVFVKGGVLC